MLIFIRKRGTSRDREREHGGTDYATVRIILKGFWAKEEKRFVIVYNFDIDNFMYTYLWGTLLSPFSVNRKEKETGREMEMFPSKEMIRSQNLVRIKLNCNKINTVNQ